jgi:hypothetical protein
MHGDPVYLIIAIVSFVLVLAGLVILKIKKQNISWLLNFALLLIVGSLFLENENISYPMVGVGILLAVVDIVRKKKDGMKKAE